MTMLTANSATAIIISAIFAICFLNETFFWKYDLTAMAFLILGSVTIVLQSNTEDKSYSSAQIKSLFLDVQGIAFLSGAMLLHAASILTLQW